MSEIRSNSIGDFSDYQKEDDELRFSLLQKFPIEVPFELRKQFDEEAQEREILRKTTLIKFKWLINSILEQIRYKNRMKVACDNVMNIDQLKTLNGLRSLKKEIVKYSVIERHSSFKECAQYLTDLILMTLVGDQVKCIENDE